MTAPCRFDEFGCRTHSFVRYGATTCPPRADICDIGLAALKDRIGALEADQRDWRKGVELIASALGEENPKDLSCVRLSEVTLVLRATVEEQARVIDKLWMAGCALRNQLLARIEEKDYHAHGAVMVWQALSPEQEA